MTDFDIIIQWAVLVVASLFMMMRGQLTVFHPSSIYLAFHALVFCIRPSFIKYGDFDFVWRYMGLTPSDELLRLTLWVSSGCLLLFIISFSLTTNQRGVKEITKPFVVTPEMRKAFIYMVILFLPLAAYSLFGAEQKGERVGGVYIMTGSSGYANDAQQVLIPISILAIILFKWKWWSFLPFLGFIYFRATQGWARWTMILPFLAIMMYHCWVNRRDLPSIKWLIPIPFIFVFFNQLSQNRMYFRNLIEGSEYAQSRIVRVDSVEDKQFAFSRQWDTLDFANFDYLAYILDKVPRETDTFTYGTQHLQLFTEPIPRKLWKNKPIGPPIQYFDLNDYGNFIGLTVSIIGDGWMSGGWIGIGINMVLAGVGLGLFYSWFIKNQHNIFKVTIFMITNSVLLQLFRDGGIVSMAKFMLFTQLPVLVWWLMHHWIMKSSGKDLIESLQEIEDQQLPQKSLQT
jgi:hypothetical protein